MATVSGPYTDLPLQIAGFLAGGLILALLIGRRGGWSFVPLAACVFLAILAVPALWGAAGGLDRVRGSLATAPGISEREACLVESGATEALGMSRWLAARIPASATFAYDAGEFDTPCLQFALLPRRIVARSAHPQYMVYAAPRDPADQARLRRQRKLPAAQRSIAFLTPQIGLERLR
jgi:hypothetical protein